MQVKRFSNNIKLSVVIPAYNEEERIRKILESYPLHFGKIFKNNYEIIVVCDGCRDKTPEIVKEFRHSNSNIRCLEFPQKLGKGGGVLKGLEASNGDIIGFVDADDAFDMHGIESLIRLINLDKYDCAIASKWKNRRFSEVTEPFFKKFASRIWNLIVKILFGLEFKDTIAGAKFLSRDALNAMGTDFLCKGFEFDTEFLWRLQKRGYSIKEIYIPSMHQESSTFKMRNSFYMLLNILKLRMRG